MRLVFPAVNGLTALLLTAAPAVAQLPSARLNGVFPPGLQAGTETVITLNGADLDDVKELRFSHPGFRAVPAEGGKFKVSAEAGVPAGLYEVRATGRYGVSNGAAFVSGALPEINGPGNNRMRTAAAEVKLPATINGTADADASGFYRFKAAKGTELRIDCAAQRIDSPLNATLCLYDAAGVEIDRSHTGMDRDPVVSFTAPADGDYTVEIHDAGWRGGATSHYRLTIAAPAEIPVLPRPVPLAGAVRPLKMEAAQKEIEPNNTAETAGKLNLPADVSGTLDEDWFSFSGEKGRVVMLEVVSHRLGELSDPVVVVRKVTRDGDGKEHIQPAGDFDDTPGPAGGERFRAGTRDPVTRIVCEEGVVYQVMVTDRFGTGGAYRLLARDPQPDFQLLAMPENPATDEKTMLRWSPLLRRNGSALVSVAVLRQDGFDGAVTLKTDGLPEGVSAAETVVPPGISTGVIVLRAAGDAKPWTGPVKISGQSGELSREAREVTARWDVADSGAERVDMRLGGQGFMLAVTDAATAPLAVEAAEPKVYETSLAGSIEVPVKFIRDASHKGFKDEWQAALYGLPGLRQWRPVKPAADAKEATLPISFAKKDGNQFTPGTWNVYAAARGTVRWQPGEKDPVRELKDTAFSAPIQVKLAPSPVFTTAPAGVIVSAGGKAEVAVKLERRYGFSGAVEVQLLPPAGMKQLSAAKVSVPKEAAEAKLVIESAADTPDGKHTCILETKCQWNGEDLFTRQEVAVELKP